jgi:hypothetical protein
MRDVWLLPVLVGSVSCGGPSEPEGSAPTAGDEVAQGATDDQAMDDEWEDEGFPEPGDGEAHVSAAEALGLTPPETPWAEMSSADREMYMVGKVLPIMEEAFRGHDPDRYASFGCETCHGDDMRETHFAMPSPRLYHLPREGTPAYAQMLRHFGPTVTFMRDEVTPTMSAIMGQPNLTCGACHTTD